MKRIIIWNDPDQIEGNNYVVDTIEGQDVKDIDLSKFSYYETVSITYNYGQSEADVLPFELVEFEIGKTYTVKWLPSYRHRQGGRTSQMKFTSFDGKWCWFSDDGKTHPIHPQSLIKRIAL